MNRLQASEINGGRLAILLNPSAGQGRAGHRWKKLEGLLRENGLSFDFYITESEEQLKRLSRRLATEGRVLVGAGGDSTFHLIINEIMKAGGKAPFGLLGLGSSNDITREFGLEPLERAVAALKLGRTKTVDLGCLKQGSKTPRYFLGQANIGLGATVNRYMEELARGKPWLARRQTLAGTIGIIKAYRERQVPIHLKVKSEKDTLEGDFISVIFSNVRYWATGKLIAPQARPDDGRLDVCLIEKCSFLRLVRINSLAKTGRHGRAPEVRLLQSAEFTVSSPAGFNIQADGEILPFDSASAVRIQAKPGALRLIC